MTRTLTLAILPGTYVVARLPPENPLPAWATEGRLFSVTRTPDELSIVCETAHVPDGVQKEDGWRTLVIEGRLDFTVTGILAGLATALAAAGVSIFALSTYDTDYLLVREHDLPKAVAALRDGGYTVSEHMGRHVERP